jgi:CRISPR/Cas system-associated protein Cas10 (large subunit of type III CRISPR-Cas system)
MERKNLLYLYGAVIQGIQGFIFETNKLKEIIGGSELVKEISEYDFFEKFEKEIEKGEVEVLTTAAGKIQAIFKNRELLEKHMLEFEREVIEKAPGITISQQVVVVEGSREELFANLDSLLFQLTKLLTQERNRKGGPIDRFIPILDIAPRTGRPLYKRFNRGKGKKEKLSLGVFKKVQKQKQIKEREQEICKFFKERIKVGMEGEEIFRLIEKKGIPNCTTDLGKLGSSGEDKRKIAILHIDGNGLGQLLPKLIELKVDIGKFSIQLDRATHRAFGRAISEIEARRRREEGGEPFQWIRKIILGGDDVTAVLKPQFALKFAELYLQFFEEETEKIFKVGVQNGPLTPPFSNGCSEKLKPVEGVLEKEQLPSIEKFFKDYYQGEGNQTPRLTAGAGIAFTPEKFPFHLGVELAEALTKEVKKRSGRRRSGVMFHSIQSSYFSGWGELKKWELEGKGWLPVEGEEEEQLELDLLFGPYYLKEEPTIGDFLQLAELFNWIEGCASRYREWLRLVESNPQLAQYVLERGFEVGKLEQMERELEEGFKRLANGLSPRKPYIQRGRYFQTPIYDLLQWKGVISVQKRRKR